MENNRINELIYNINIVDYISIIEYVREGNFEQALNIIFTYLGEYIIEGDDEHNMRVADLALGILAKQPPLYQDFEYNGKPYRLVDFEKLSTGEFIDLEEYNKLEQFVRLAHIIYRPATETGEIEKYEGASKYEDIFENIPYVLVAQGLKHFKEFRATIISNYPYLYPQVETTSENDDNDFNFTEEDNFSEEFGWYSMLYVAANEGYLKINGYDNVIDSPAEEFLAFMNFFKRKTELDIKRIKQPGSQQ
mgnify:CR=1 FL=1